MLELLFDAAPDRAMRVLCIGAHCDDIEIGCAGTLMRLQTTARPMTIDWAVLSGTRERRAETKQAMDLIVRPECRGNLRVGEFADGRFPAQYGEIKEFVEALKSELAPDLIFCHERDDRHQDHRLVNEMIWNTYRNQLVLEYEIPKWDGGLGHPNLYVPLDTAHAEAKVDMLLAAYASQAERDWFSRHTFESMMRLRGIECRASSGFAEAFYGRKLRLKGL